MKPARFQYACPGSLAETLALLDAYQDDVAILAGGQSLVPMMNTRVARPAMLIDINRLDKMDLIECQGDRLVIGARARHNDVLRSPEVRSRAPLLVQALHNVAHEAIRNRGTLGGSLALADPAAELPACAICLEAEIIALSSRGERRIPAGEFFKGLYATDLEADELITRVEFPIPPAGWRFHFSEVARRQGDFAMAGIAVALLLQDGAIANCRIVFTGVEVSPRRARTIEECLVGGPLTSPVNLALATAAIRKDLEAMEGGEFSSEYRVHLACELLSAALRALAASPNREAH